VYHAEHTMTTQAPPPVALRSEYSGQKSTYVNAAASLRNVQPTTRELQVLQLICDGCTSKEIAAQLKISFKTASTHRANLMEKVGVHSSIALFRWALTSGFVSCELGKETPGQRAGTSPGE
jgi:DNA-binding NarL/FixJ family response regulator